MSALTPDQESAVRAWAAAGDNLSTIQTRLADEFGIHMSYMDVRFLVLDLDVTLAERPAPKAPEDLSKAAPARAPAPPAAGQSPDGLPADDLGDDLGEEEDSCDDPECAGHRPPAPGAPGDEDAAPAANVKVELSRLARPGFALTGTVTFTDGVTADWGITQRGELALTPDEAHADYQPTREDVRAFQVELRKAISRAGYGM